MTPAYQHSRLLPFRGRGVSDLAFLLIVWVLPLALYSNTCNVRRLKAAKIRLNRAKKAAKEKEAAAAYVEMAGCTHVTSSFRR